MRLHQALGMWFCISHPGGTQASMNIWNRYYIIQYIYVSYCCVYKKQYASGKISKTRKHLVILSHILMLIQDSVLPSFTLVAIARATQVRKWGSIQQSCCLTWLPVYHLYISLRFSYENARIQFHILFSFVVISSSAQSVWETSQRSVPFIVDSFFLL